MINQKRDSVAQSALWASFVFMTGLEMQPSPLSFVSRAMTTKGEFGPLLTLHDSF